MTQKEKLQSELIDLLLELKDLYQCRTPPELGVILRGKIKRLEQSISQLQVGECYPRDFVEWFKYETIYWHCSIDGEIKYYEQEQGMLTNQIEYLTFHQIFEYWQSKVKNELTHNNQ